MFLILEMLFNLTFLNLKMSTLKEKIDIFTYFRKTSII